MSLIEELIVGIFIEDSRVDDTENSLLHMEQ